MNMNLNIKIEATGSIAITHKHECKLCQESSTETIDLNGLKFNISIEEKVDDISPQEYIKAVGSVVKDVVLSAFATKKNSNKPENIHRPLNTKSDLRDKCDAIDKRYEQEIERIEREYNDSVENVLKEGKPFVFHWTNPTSSPEGELRARGYEAALRLALNYMSNLENK